MRTIKFRLTILFCLHAQSIKAGDWPINKIIVTAIAVGVGTTYAVYKCISTPDKKELDQHREKFARLASLRASQEQKDSNDDDWIGRTSYVK